MKAGARSAEKLLKLINGEKVEYIEKGCSNGAIYSRFDQSVCISEGDKKQPIKGIIFDLDDTLYSEKEYIRSGYKKIGELLQRPEAAEKMWYYFKNNKAAIDMYLTEIGEIDKKPICLDTYRNQMPEISLYDGVREVLAMLKNKGIKLGIITDGRPEGQRKKLRALRLEEMVDDIIITDELGGTQFRKPNDISFRIIQNRWRVPFEQIMYVGDNYNKDFQACKQLGMRWKHFQNKDGLYLNSDSDEYVCDIREILLNESISNSTSSR